jgi:cytoskeletal protein CcmA (bactofilin family)
LKTLEYIKMVKTVITRTGLFLYNTTNAEVVNLTYTGEATFAGNVTTTQTFIGDGGGSGYDDPSNISIHTLNVNSTTTLSNTNITTNLIVGGNLTVSQTTYLADVEMTGSLDVSGEITGETINATNELIVGDNATVGGNLTVS